MGYHSLQIYKFIVGKGRTCTQKTFIALYLFYFYKNLEICI